ncbi:diacylglycerol/lipid kinase family protein [Bifidobacterium felsineum]|uniref:Diacylglycerol kinase n=1 Tax=Bifidobacterium felsineum TaxID=2045440 RepID=A0A2M9HMX0_9BIFI|nr:diacylglycerol kinase family protein [Bifidobacterium felsineum]PJM78145.1 diacylglycerol kinase [Bifidobacterium felsineum]
MTESERSKCRTVVGLVGNPTSDKGRGAKVDAQVLSLLREAGTVHGFDVLDLTGTSFNDSLNRARERAHEYDYLVVVGGDGMIALGANAVGCSGKPLGIVSMGSGNDFARGLKLPVNRIETAVEGIVGAIVRGSHIDVDMGRVTSLEGGYSVDPSTGSEYETPEGESAAHVHPIDRYYAGMLSCGIDASINDRANHSHLPNGSLRYFAAVLVELTHMKRYGYHIKATLADGSVEERDIISPLLTVANSRHIGGGIEVSPYSCFSDGLLDLVWMDHVPNFHECVVAISNAYNGKLLASNIFGWKRVREIEITRAQEGDEPPILMADGEYVGHLPVRVVAEDCALRVLVPPAVAAHEIDSKERVAEAIVRDGRDPITGAFA